MKKQSKQHPEENGEFVDVPVRVRYADTDMMGVVYHANYPVFFEIGRSEYMRQKGFTYREFETMGYHLVVTGLEAKYYNSATYDDLLTVRTRISELAITRTHISLYNIQGQNTPRGRNNKTPLHS